jgi:hypothetical protein
MAFPTNWSQELANRIADLNTVPGMPAGIPAANADMIATVVVPAPGGKTPTSGASCVANISSEHIPSFCAAVGVGYLNAYDLVRLGIDPKAVSPTRARVDAALAAVTRHAASNIYFVAAELNGTGIRFYGDLCLVLKPWATLDKTVLLSTNSYDLVRKPLSASTTSSATLLTEAGKLAGLWDQDLASMAGLKVLAHRYGTRRLTTGQVSDSLLDDEDYLEVLRIGPFSVADVEEARLSAAGVAQDARIDERLRHGPTPDPAALKWRQRRRNAERMLVAHGVPVRVVATTGRTRV